MAYVEPPRKMGLSGSGDPPKPAIESGTIIGAVVALIAWFVSIWGHQMSEYDIVQLTEAGKNAVHAGADLIGVLATIFAIWKRYTATEEIEGVFKTPAESKK